MYKNGFMSSYISDAGGGARLNLDYWTRNNPSNQIYGMGIPSSNYRDAIFFQDASFLRIADVTVGYTLPKAKTDKMGIDKMRFYLQLINPAYFTKFLGGDPEYNGAAYQDVPGAVFEAKLFAAPDDLIFIGGSTFIVAEALP